MSSSFKKTKQAEEEIRQVELIRDILIEQEKEGEIQDDLNREDDELEHGDDDEDVEDSPVAILLFVNIVLLVNCCNDSVCSGRFW